MAETIYGGKLTKDTGLIYDGIYTPTPSAATGITSVGNFTASFIRDGKGFAIGGTFTLQPSTLTGQVAFYVPLPSFIVTNFSVNNLGGVAHPGNIALLCPPLNIVNENGGLRALFNGSNLGHTSNNTWSFSLTGSMA